VRVRLQTAANRRHQISITPSTEWRSPVLTAGSGATNAVTALIHAMAHELAQAAHHLSGASEVMGLHKVDFPRPA